MVVATVLGCVFLLQVSSVILNEVCYQKKKNTAAYHRFY